MKLRVIFIIILLATPITGWAMQETVWDFRGGKLPGEWRLSGSETPQLTSEGMRITASREDLTLLTDLALPHPVEVVTLVFGSDRDAEAVLLWHRPADDSQKLVQLPLTIPRGEQTTMDLNVDSYPQWNRRADTIGLHVPADTDVLLREIRFRHWNLFERATEAMRSFWVFDRFSPLNINFFWGPLITSNPIGTRDLFTTLPPGGKSGMRILYGLLIAVATGMIAYFWWRGIAWRRWLTAFLLCFGAVWIFFDLRMGLEMLRYVKADYDTYLSQPPGSRTFRTYLNFNDVVEQSLPALQGESQFALLRPREAPIIAMVRYFAYPSLPEEVTGPRDDLHFWLVFERPDVAVNDEGRLTVDGVPWTQPGTIIDRNDQASFLFAVNSAQPYP